MLQFFLQIAIEFDRIVLSDDEADLAAVGAEVAQDAFSDALKATVNQAVGHHQSLDERLEAARDVEVSKLKS